MVENLANQDFSQISNDKLRILFYEACSKNDIKAVLYLINNPIFNEFTKKHVNALNEGINTAFSKGYEELIQVLLDHHKISRSLALDNISNASLSGQINMIKLLFNSHQLNLELDIDDMNKIFLDASIKGNLELVKYLTSSDDLKLHADIGYKDGQAIDFAGMQGNAEMMKFYLSLPNFDEKFEIHQNDDNFFKNIVINSLSGAKSYNSILNSIIFDYNIEKTESISKFIKTNDLVSHMFEMRELNQQLKNDIDSSKDTSTVKENKNKI